MGVGLLWNKKKKQHVFFNAWERKSRRKPLLYLLLSFFMTYKHDYVIAAKMKKLILAQKNLNSFPLGEWCSKVFFYTSILFKGVSVELDKSTWRAHSFFWIYHTGNTSARVCFDQTWYSLEWGGEKTPQRIWKEIQRTEWGERELQKGITLEASAVLFCYDHKN